MARRTWDDREHEARLKGHRQISGTRGIRHGCAVRGSWTTVYRIVCSCKTPTGEPRWLGNVHGSKREAVKLWRRHLMEIAP